MLGTNANLCNEFLEQLHQEAKVQGLEVRQVVSCSVSPGCSVTKGYEAAAG